VVEPATCAWVMWDTAKAIPAINKSCIDFISLSSVGSSRDAGAAIR
jgi:hypothetical protein